jgi:hypothetical protein
MENIRETMLQLHLWPIGALALLVLINLVVVALQQDDKKLEKYLRIQAIGWITLMTMVIFTGATMMAFYHMGFSTKIIVMIAAAAAMAFLELRRHLLLKKSRPGQECFMQARRLFFRYYALQFVWLMMVGGLSPLI